jgi:hypothetical protein
MVVEQAARLSLRGLDDARLRSLLDHRIAGVCDCYSMNEKLTH